MDVTLLISLLAFAGMVTSWIILPTGRTATETATEATAAAVPSTSEA